MSDQPPTTAIPVIPIRAGFYFPGVQLPLSAGRKRSVHALNAACENAGWIFLIHQREVDAPEPPPEAFPTIGTLAQVRGDMGTGGRWEGRVHGITRAWVKKWRKSKLFLSADLEPIASSGSDAEVLHRLRAAMIRSIELDPAIPDKAGERLVRIDDLSLLTDIAAQNATDLHRAEKQRLLETADAVIRAAALIPRFEAHAAELSGAPPPSPNPPRPCPRDDPGPKPLEDALARVRWTADLLARCGGVPPVGVVELSLDDVEGADAATLELARALARQAADDRRALEDRWPLRTDFDRLDGAFVALNQAGIAARHDWGLNAEDGMRLFDQELARRKNADRYRGLLYYHSEQTQAAAKGRGLRLQFSARSGDPTALGREIVEVLRDHGLPACWAADPDQPIEVPIRWQRRMPPDPR